MFRKCFLPVPLWKRANVADSTRQMKELIEKGGRI